MERQSTRCGSGPVPEGPLRSALIGCVPLFRSAFPAGNTGEQVLVYTTETPTTRGFAALSRSTQHGRQSVRFWVWFKPAAVGGPRDRNGRAGDSSVRAAPRGRVGSRWWVGPPRRDALWVLAV